MRVTTVRQVALLSALVTVMAVGVPSLFLWIFLPPFLPHFVKVPVYLTLIAVPLFVAVPLAAFGLHMFRLLNNTIDALDAHVKFDHLTGLLSRGYLLAGIEQARAKGGHFLMIDADHFKRINDGFGHDGGDEALKSLARLIQASFGASGLCGRLGGEEFAVYLPGSDAAQAKLAAAALGTAVRSHELMIKGRKVPLTVSLGISEDRPAMPLTAAMKAADEALYAAKAAGRDRFVCAFEGTPEAARAA